MLTLYFDDIRKFGNDPTNLGVDEILKKYCEKYQFYEDRFGQTIEILTKLQNPQDAISFSFTDRKGIEQEVSGTVEEIILDRSKSLPFLSSQYGQMDPKIYEEIVKYRGGVFNNPQYVEKFKGYYKKYESLTGRVPQRPFPWQSICKDVARVRVKWTKNIGIAYACEPRPGRVKGWFRLQSPNQ